VSVDRQGRASPLPGVPLDSYRDIRVSPDAIRHKRFGPSFLHRYLPFWLASLVDRTMVVLVPIVVVLIPAIKLVPALYRWRVRTRIYKRYGELMALERDIFAQPTAAQRAELSKRLDDIGAIASLSTPDEFRKVIESDIHAFREVAKTAGLEPQ
jgi:hypothetical protein